jgi:hypothetical protein
VRVRLCTQPCFMETRAENSWILAGHTTQERSSTEFSKTSRPEIRKGCRQVNQVGRLGGT